MCKFSSSRAVILLAILGLPLAGCATDSLFEDDNITPYGGSKMHPIKVVNGRAVVEDCGKWPENLANTASNELSYNHGCAVQANIAAMAAYPEDLVYLRKMSAKPAFNRVAAVKALGTGGAAAAAAPSAPAAATPAKTP